MKYLKFLIISLFLLNGNFVFAQSQDIDDKQNLRTIYEGTPEDVKKLIQSGYNVNKAYSCQTPLIMAVKSSYNGKKPQYALEKVKLLVEAGAEIDQVGCPGLSMSALHWAVSAPFEIQREKNEINETIDKKTKNKISEEKREKVKLTLNEAIEQAYNHPPYYMEIIDFLLKNGGNINLQSGEIKIAPIHLAAGNPSETSLDPLKLLIEKGADLNIQDREGQTPLFYAYGLNNGNAVDLLLNAGANKDIISNLGNKYNQSRLGRTKTIFDRNGNLLTHFE